MPNTPNMNLPESIVNVDSGLTWEQNLNKSLTIIDGHNHTTGYGVPIPPAGLNINSDLSSHIINDANTMECFLATHNPETQEPFTNSGDVYNFIYTSVIENPNYWMPYKTPEQHAAEKLKSEVILEKTNGCFTSTNIIGTNDG